MAKTPTHDVTVHLLATPFTRNTLQAQSASDPLVDTPMRITLEQLRPYNLNPRRSPNPQYQAIKASIRQRGLDQPPSITRRPDEEHFIIRNGGNTRLAILNELWKETGEERFHCFLCLFRPWTMRGEILALTGHLAENELRGSLSYIERSQAVEQARQLYEQECGKPLNQRELAERLTEDGYPIDQPAISRMGDTLTHLLPAIPDVLYAGLGRPQIRKLLNLRKAAQHAWQRHAPEDTGEFAPAFQHSLARCDGDLAQFSVERVRDELIGDLAQRLELDYDELALDLGESDLRHNMLSQMLQPEVPLPRPEPSTLPTLGLPSLPTKQSEIPCAEQLRDRIANLTHALVNQSAPSLEIVVQPRGLGFACRCVDPSAIAPQEQALLTLLQALTTSSSAGVVHLADLLCGTAHTVPWMSDEALSQLFRLIKLARLLPHTGESDA